MEIGLPFSELYTLTVQWNAHGKTAGFKVKFFCVKSLKTIEILRNHYRHDFVKGARMRPFECPVYVI